MNTAVVALLILAVVVAALVSHKRRDVGYRGRRASGYRARMRQAREEGPDALIISAADYLAANLRHLPDKRQAWVIAEETAAAMTEAATGLDRHVTKGGKA